MQLCVNMSVSMADFCFAPDFAIMLWRFFFPRECVIVPLRWRLGGVKCR